MGHPTDGAFNVASSRKVHFISELCRQKNRIVAIFIQIHFPEIYIGSYPQTTDNCVSKLNLLLWRDVVFVESFYGEFDTYFS